MNRLKRNSFYCLAGLFIALFFCSTSALGEDKGPIASGESHTGEIIIPDNAQDTYTFQGTAGDYIVLTAAAITYGVQPQIFLYPPDNSGIEASETGTDNNKTLSHVLGKSGLYTIFINEHNMDQDGEYGIAFLKIPGAASSPRDADGGPIASGETLLGNLVPHGDTDAYQFYGEAGDHIVITAAGITYGVQPHIFLYPPDNSGIEASEIGTDNDKTLNHVLDMSGLYTILITESNMDQDGEYGVAFLKIPGAATSPNDTDGGVIASGETLSGNLMPHGDTDAYQFYGDAGDYVVISAAGITYGVQPQVFLYQPESGGIEASLTGTDNDKILNHSLEKNGLYTIVVDESNMDQDGEYSVSLTKMPPISLGIDTPYPSDKSSVEITCQDLTWEAVPGAIGYDVYAGKNGINPLVKIGEGLSTPSIPVFDMDMFTVYYWHVVAHTPAGDIQGPFWWFETNGLRGDSNSDGDVDGKDLKVLADAQMVFDPTADLDNNSKIDVNDVILFLCNFGRFN